MPGFQQSPSELGADPTGRADDSNSHMVSQDGSAQVSNRASRDVPRPTAPGAAPAAARRDAANLQKKYLQMRIHGPGTNASVVRCAGGPQATGRTRTRGVRHTDVGYA